MSCELTHWNAKTQKGTTLTHPFVSLRPPILNVNNVNESSHCLLFIRLSFVSNDCGDIEILIVEIADF